MSIHRGVRPESSEEKSQKAALEGNLRKQLQKTTPESYLTYGKLSKCWRCFSEHTVDSRVSSLPEFDSNNLMKKKFRKERRTEALVGSFGCRVPDTIPPLTHLKMHIWSIFRATVEVYLRYLRYICQRLGYRSGDDKRPRWYSDGYVVHD